MRMRNIAAVMLLAAGCSGQTGSTGGSGGGGGSRPPSGNPNGDMASTGPGPGAADMAQQPSAQPDFSMMPSPNGDMAPSSGDMAMGPPSNCDYPKGSYGTKEGDILDPGKMWECYAPGGGDTTVMISPKDLIDCDGKRGINGILLDSGGVGCGACEQMSMDMPNEAQMNMWKELGIRAVLSVANPYSSGVGTIKDAKDWRDMFKLQDTAYVCAASKNNYISYGFAPSTPVIDPRTMKFYFAPTESTFSDGGKKVVEIAKKNKM